MRMGKTKEEKKITLASGVKHEPNNRTIELKQSINQPTEPKRIDQSINQSTKHFWLLEFSIDRLIDGLEKGMYSDLGSVPAQGVDNVLRQPVWNEFRHAQSQSLLECHVIIHVHHLPRVKVQQHVVRMTIAQSQYVSEDGSDGQTLAVTPQHHPPLFRRRAGKLHFP